MAIDNVDIGGTEFAGAMKVRFADVEISTYSNGGEDFGPSDAGMHRYQFVDANVADGSGFFADYDYNAETIRLYQQTDSDSLAAGVQEFTEATGVDATVKVMVMGR